MGGGGDVVAPFFLGGGGGSACTLSAGLPIFFFQCRSRSEMGSQGIQFGYH